MISSSLMIGSVQHTRYLPIKHQFSYSMFMASINLDDLETLQKKVWLFGNRWWHWARFKRSDYLGDGSLKVAVQNKVFELTGEKFSGRVMMVCHLRYLGLYFSPVNFYYVYDDDGKWRYLLAEVSNTPWNERHYYAISADQDSESGWEHKKAFHVSPFNPVDQDYVWKLKPLSERLFVHLECRRSDKEFDATLALKANEFTSCNLAKVLVKTPIQTIKVVTGIYWQALKLFIKKAPLYQHPGKTIPENAVSDHPVSDRNRRDSHV
ncbi:DUF1365 domain-containing protein [Vibrio hannami]|uniref:DUF1365 domain-containing protein n=1 Tax=Vibrio hannami TaxID=2717094 RepID=UPI0024104EF7|nr:DUF1365 domain-containing protein [Vibrio hannami]MDG3087671.1 DUF1365 domain-containing protein [Vibrio hannami]